MKEVGEFSKTSLTLQLGIGRRLATETLAPRTGWQIIGLTEFYDMTTNYQGGIRRIEHQYDGLSNCYPLFIAGYGTLLSAEVRTDVLQQRQ